MRLLFLTYQGGLAGSTNSIAYLCKGLAERGHDVYAGIREESDLWSILEDSKVRRVPMTFTGKFDRNNWKQIRDVVREFDIQLINAQSSYDRYTSSLANWYYRLGTKVIHTRRQMPLSIGGLQSLFYNRFTDGIVAVSTPVKDSLVRIGIKKDLVKVIHNGTPREKYENIDLEKVRKLRDRFEIKDGEFVLGCISRLKNQLQIFEALALIEEPVKAIFCGMEPTEEIQEIIASYTVPHVIQFDGNVSFGEILNYYKLFTAKILASTTEGLSQSLLEAMALGVPVTATAAAGNLDLVEDGVNGLLFEDGNIEQIADNILRLKNDPDLRQRLITGGNKSAYETFSIENTLDNYELYFQKLLGV